MPDLPERRRADRRALQVSEQRLRAIIDEQSELVCRFLPDLTSSNGQRRLAAERMAMNMPIQGGAADIMKIAMNHMSSALRESDLKAKVLLQVHDELVLEVDRSDLEPAAE